ncbi:PREDICTED: tubulin-specific chaperone C-like [Amphimedon queenslandica]|uniref:C-CAP/cofactor C-like domain-containing protein n=1 Tax=Amphimedon queenslandica TaxID=400682 RepID=A0A1X7UQI0_AMPQE|nr:PREDICTED: tubulin-specific chaperone C-like [Amphimedon queenslandica]|eukprot:XP_003387097.1 PREDICTED: tubulin-specific chaperone C-like [Amphimedon queenslandica]
MASVSEEQNDALKIAIEKRREETHKAEETQDYFEAEFATKKKEVDDLVASIPQTPKESLKDTFAEISKKLNGLTKLISDSSLFIAPFTVKTYHRKVFELQQLVNKSEEELLPKQKFSFKSRTKKTATSKTSDKVIDPLPELGTSAFTASNAVVVKERNDSTIDLQPSEVNGSDVVFSDLSSCTVRIYGTPGALTISKCTGTKILSGPIQRSIFVEDCSNSHFVVSCQQLRVHSTTNSVFYLHVTSRPIIEDSKGLQFAPYNWSYPDYNDHLLLSGLSPEVNNWDKVNDFNWLSSKEHSPNWSILPQAHRESNLGE